MSWASASRPSASPICRIDRVTPSSDVSGSNVATGTPRRRSIDRVAGVVKLLASTTSGRSR